MDYIRRMEISKLFIICYIIGAIIGLYFSILSHLNKESTLISILIGCFMAYLLSKKYNQNLENPIEKKQEQFLKIYVIFYVLLFISILVVSSNRANTYSLPIDYFLLISLSFILIFSEIMDYGGVSSFLDTIILIQIIALSTLVTANFLFLFPTPYGNDSSYHIDFINYILSNANTYGPGQYKVYPGYQLLYVFINFITEIRGAMEEQIFISTVQTIIISLFLLKILRFNIKIGLISVLMVSFSPYIFMSKYIIFPLFETVFFFIALLYLTFKSRTVGIIIVVMILFLGSIVFHPMAPLIIIIVLLAILVISHFLHLNKNITTFNLILLFSITTVMWWMRPYGPPGAEESIITYLIRTLRDTILSFDLHSEIGKATLAPTLNWFDVTLYDLGFVMMISFGVGGAFYVLKNYKITNDDEGLIALSMLTLMLIPLPYVLTIIIPQSLPARWYPFIEILICIYSAIAFFVLYNKSTRYSILNYSILVILFLIVFLNISGPLVNPNDDLYAQNVSTRSALTQSELNAKLFINNHDVKDLHGNSKYINFINYTLSNPSHFIIYPESALEAKNQFKGSIVIRNWDIVNGFTIPLYGWTGKLLEIVRPNKAFFDYINSTSKIFEDGNTRVFV